MGTSNEETDSSGFVKSLNDGIARGIPIESILKSMPQECINTYLLAQVESLSKQHDELAEQFRAVISAVKTGNKNVTDRIEHILALFKQCHTAFLNTVTGYRLQVEFNILLIHSLLHRIGKTA